MKITIYGCSTRRLAYLAQRVVVGQMSGGS
jgi:hypothetical protein